eukprot:GHRR01020916.1.p1 GENE.GHRR01020916.1~~GHRR01020916.1.p1  ORF type:complete len:458 (+),score=125.90 GHRR01020916.1:187-1560(+)
MLPGATTGRVGRLQPSRFGINGNNFRLSICVRWQRQRPSWKEPAAAVKAAKAGTVSPCPPAALVLGRTRGLPCLCASQHAVFPWQTPGPWPAHRASAASLQPGRQKSMQSAQQRLGQIVSAFSAYAATGDEWQLTHHWYQRLVPSWLQRNWPVVQRLLVTVTMLVIIRCGYFIPVPGVDLAALPTATSAMEGERMMRALYGQAQALPASLFDLGISPHINASIIITMLLILPKELLPFPWANRLREARKEGKGGEALINDRINYLALLFALYAAFMRAMELAPYALYSQGFVVQTTLALIAGSFMIHHAANTITAAGVGNGSTLVICMGIIIGYASTLHQVLVGLESASLAPWVLLALLGGYLGLLLFSVYLASSEIRLPIVQYSKAPPPDAAQPGGGGRHELLSAARALLDKKASAAGRQGPHFPLLLNSSGVMVRLLISSVLVGLFAQFHPSPQL